MALQTIPGGGAWLPPFPYLPRSLTLTSTTIDATGEKVAWLGRVETGGGTKSVRTVGFLFGTVTKSGGSAMTVSLQDVDIANGAPYRPDGTQDQTVAIANADAGFVSNAWYQTGNLSADRSVTHGDLLAVVLEYDGSGRSAPDTVSVRNLISAPNESWHIPGVSHFTTSWSALTTLPNIILGFSDGTFGTITGSFPLSAEGNAAFKQDTGTADEYALEWEVPFPCKVDAAWLRLTPAANTSDFDVVLYEGTTALATVSHDANIAATDNTVRYFILPFGSHIQLAANTTYRLAVKPTQTTSTVSLYYYDVANASHFQAIDGGESMVLTTRLDLGSWAASTTTRRPFMGLRMVAFDDGAGGGAASMMRPVTQSGGLV